MATETYLRPKHLRWCFSVKIAEVNDSRYIPLFVFSGSIKGFSQLIVSIFFLPQYFFQEILPGRKVFGYPTLLIPDSLTFTVKSRSLLLQKSSIIASSSSDYFVKHSLIWNCMMSYFSKAGARMCSTNKVLIRMMQNFRKRFVSQSLLNKAAGVNFYNSSS